jgi:hypothetical protein
MHDSGVMDEATKNPEISVSEVLYIINFANCYQNGPPKSDKITFW